MAGAIQRSNETNPDKGCRSKGSLQHSPVFVDGNITLSSIKREEVTTEGYDQSSQISGRGGSARSKVHLRSANRMKDVGAREEPKR